MVVGEAVIVAGIGSRKGVTATEVLAAIDAAITDTGATGASDMGKLMAMLKPKLAGQADMGEVSKLVKQRLAG